MNKEIAIELKSKVEEVARHFSNPDRERNFNQEKFEVEEIIAISDHTAIVKFKKTSGKIGLAFFYYIPQGLSKGWKYFFPTDSHLSGFRAFEFYKFVVEKDNYSINML